MVGLSATDSPLIEHGDEQEGSPLIAEVYTDSDRLPAAANARLIAAAPALLEALEAVMYKVDGDHSFSCSADVIHETPCVCGRDSARDAIKLARQA